MKMNQFVNATPRFKVLSDDQIERIYFSALEVLERVGAEIYNEDALALFRASDAVVTGGSEERGRVRVPASMVEEALNFYPGKITLKGRNGERSLFIQKDSAGFGTGSDLPFCYDRETGERRRTGYEDIRQAARLVDALPNYDFFMSHGIVGDAPNPQTYDRHQFMAMIEQCTKPMVLTSVDGEGLEDLWRMACLIQGGEKEFRLNPMFVAYIEPISPLKNDNSPWRNYSLPLKKAFRRCIRLARAPEPLRRRRWRECWCSPWRRRCWLYRSAISKNRACR